MTKGGASTRPNDNISDYGQRVNESSLEENKEHSDMCMCHGVYSGNSAPFFRVQIRCDSTGMGSNCLVFVLLVGSC